MSSGSQKEQYTSFFLLLSGPSLCLCSKKHVISHVMIMTSHMITAGSLNPLWCQTYWHINLWCTAIALTLLDPTGLNLYHEDLLLRIMGRPDPIPSMHLGRVGKHSGLFASNKHCYGDSNYKWRHYPYWMRLTLAYFYSCQHTKKQQ